MSNQSNNTEPVIASLRKQLRFYKLVSVIYTLVLLGIAGGYAWSKLVVPVYEIRVNGKAVAASSSRETADRVLDLIKHEKSGTMEENAEFVQRVDVRPAFFSKLKPSSTLALKSKLETKLTLKVPAAVIMANDNPAAAFVTKEDAETALEKLKAKFSEGKELVGAPEIKEKISIETVVIDPAAVFDKVEDGIEAMLMGGEESEHTVSEGENAWKIARDYGMELEQLQELNPGRNLDRLSVGDTLRVAETKASVTVVTTERQSFTREIPVHVQIQENPRVRRGKEFIIRHGKPGIRRITQLVTYENGLEVHRETESTVILTQPRDEIKVVGTYDQPERRSRRRR